MSFKLPWSIHVSAADWAGSTQLWNGTTQNKHNEGFNLNFAVGFEEGEEKAVRCVNRMEAPSKAKLTESVKKLSFNSNLCDKSFSYFIAILLFYYKDHLHCGVQRVHHLPHHCCDCSHCIQVKVFSNLDSFSQFWISYNVEDNIRHNKIIEIEIQMNKNKKKKSSHVG